MRKHHPRHLTQKRAHTLLLSNNSYSIPEICSIYSICRQTITSSAVVACFAQIANKIDKPTVVVMDNASIHTSKEFNEKLEQWKEKKLTIFRLPAYSPELDIIEILWRKIKYE